MTMPLDRELEEVALLGVGGMGWVYLVRSRSTGREHALKVIRHPLPSLRARLEREWSLQRRVRHPNVVVVEGLVALDAGLSGLLMEYVEGPSLARWLARRRMDVEEVDVLARGILAGVEALHAHELVHRDLKPSNILLEVHEDLLVPKVSDFGLAKLVASEGSFQTMTGAVLGTPHYMAPEQLTDAKRVDGRADVYALGAMFYEMLAGVPPHGRGSQLEVLARVQRGEVESLERRCPEAPARMVRAVDRALASDPGERWASVAEMRQAWAAETPPPPPEAAWTPETIEEARRLGNERTPVEGTGPELVGSCFNTGFPAPSRAGAGQPGETLSLPQGGDPAPADPAPAQPRRRGARLLALAMTATLAAAGVALLLRRGGPAEERQGTAGDPSFVRLTYNPLERPLAGVALSPDGRRILVSDPSGLHLLEDPPAPPATVPLPPGMRPGMVTWCGDRAIAAVLTPEGQDGGGAWWTAGPGAPWRRLLDGVEVRACSWDGERLLVAGAGSRGLAVIEVESGAVRRLPVGEDVVGAAAWSPSGSRIAYVRLDGDRIVLEALGMEEGARPRRVREEGPPYAMFNGLAWDARDRLYWLRQRENERDDDWTRVMVQRGLEGPTEVLLPRVGPLADLLSVSRDGSRLAFRTMERQRNLYIFDLDARALRQVTRGPARTFAGPWIDGGRIAVSRWSGRSLDLYTMRPDGSDLQPLLSASESLYGLVPIPGDPGGWYLVREGEAGVELVERRGSTERVRWRGEGHDYLARGMVRCIPGPRCYLGVREADGIALQRILADRLEPIALLPAEALARATGWDVAADGRRVAWSANGDLAVRDLQTGATRTVPVAGMLQDVVWGPGERVVLGTALDVEGASYALVRIDPGSGRVELLHGDVGWMSHLALAPGGDRLALTRTTYDAVAWMVDLDQP